MLEVRATRVAEDNMGTKTRQTLAVRLMGVAFLAATACLGQRPASSSAYAAELARPPDAIEVRPAAPTTGVARKALQGAATGDGTATNADCERYAEAINIFLDAEEMARDYGRRKEARTAAGQAAQVMNKAENEGCFWIY